MGRRLWTWLVLAAGLAAAPATALAQDAGVADAGVADGGADAGDAGDAGAPRGGITPPQIVDRARPAYPADGNGRRVDVELLLTIDEAGAVVGAEVLGHVPNDAPESFDAAARAAVRAMRFEPARRDGVPTAVRMRFHLAIAPPVVSQDAGVAPDAGPPEVDEMGAGAEGLIHSHGAPPPSTPAAPPTTPARPGTPGTTPAAPEPPSGEATIHGRVLPPATAGSVAVQGNRMQVAQTTTGDVTGRVPGVVLANEGTEGHAQHVFLRGFTGENGQDIQFTLDGVPLNEESNVHGQGYVDLYFIIPELVGRVEAVEGVADPRQGNFAVAGSINYHLALPRRGVTLRGTYGSFNYQRLVALYGPSDTPDETFAGVELTHSDGFGPARNFDRASALAQHVFELGTNTRARVLASVYTTRWVSPGVVREDDVDAGRVGFFDTYSRAGRQGGASTRALVVAALDWRRGLEHAEMRLYGQARDLGLTENFTGFVVRPQAGDLIEQRYGGVTVGANGSYTRSARIGPRLHDLEVGWFLRHDRYALLQRRLDALTSAPSEGFVAGDVDADVHATNVAAYLDATARVLPFLNLRAGARLDALSYDVGQEVFRTADRRFERVNRTALGVHVGPKATAEALLGRGFSLAASVGSGFRSPDALTLADGENAPFTSVTGQELALRWARPVRAPTAATVSATLSGYHTYVGTDLLFDPSAGRAVPIGATRRLGAALWVTARPLPWLDVLGSVTYTRATVESDALGMTVPAGSLLPYVPPWVARLDAAAERPVGRFRGLPLVVRGGLSVQYVGARPLPLDDRSEPVFLLDAMAGFRVGPVELDLAAKNLLDARWRDAQLNFASNYTPGATPSFFPVRHFTAGAPLQILATLVLYL